jgi:hypothetical protein
MPFALTGLKLGTDDYSVEGTILLDLHHFVDVVEIVTEILISWVVARPSPSVVHLRPRELVLRDLGVHGCTRVTVPSPCTSEIVACFEDDSLEPSIAKRLEHVYTR